MFLQEDIQTLLDAGKIKGTSLDALTEQDASSYITSFSENLDLLVSTDDLALLPRYIYENIPKGRRALLLNKTLQTVKHQYDFILIDTPPSLSEMTLNALGASDGVLVIFECSQLARSALDKFFDTIDSAKQINPKLKVLGVLPTMIEQRRSDPRVLLEGLRSDEFFKKYVLDQVIARKATIGRLPIYGFKDNPELIAACDQYIDVVEELVKRVC